MNINTLTKIRSFQIHLNVFAGGLKRTALPRVPENTPELKIILK